MWGTSCVTKRILKFITYIRRIKIETVKITQHTLISRSGNGRAIHANRTASSIVGLYTA